MAEAINFNEMDVVDLDQLKIYENGKVYRIQRILEKVAGGKIYRRYDFVASDGGVWMEFNFQKGRTLASEPDFVPREICSFR